MNGPETYVCTNCGYEFDIADVKDAVAIAAEGAPMLGLSDDPLGVQAPEPDHTTPAKYNIIACPNCGEDHWEPVE